MADEELVRYVQERLDEGYDERKIRKTLEDEGRTAPEIDKAFRHARKSRGPNLLIPLALIILIALSAALYFGLQGTMPGPPPPETGGAETPSPPSTGALALAERLTTDSASKSPDETYYETVQAAEQEARGVADAILLCGVNGEVRYRNYCLQEIAESWREPRLCEVIGDAEQRDDCYLGLVFLGEDQYCAKLLIEEKQRICANLLGKA